MKPKLIVELGVRGGDSTFVLSRVARLCGSRLISVDLQDCSQVCSDRHWIFVQAEDIEFAKQFQEWCKTRGIEPKIDVLFIDTSHLFEHTVKEIEHYFPFLSEKAKVFFHDTNLRHFSFRADGSMCVGWDNKRGVIRALENYFEKSFNEKVNFMDIAKGWWIKHYANCNGFTILERLPPLENQTR
ncbi:MAG: class I SAM-dependent methyltransferase [bacterium]